MAEATVTVDLPDGAARELGPDHDLDGGDALPGFRVRVGGLLEARGKR